jgi:dTDP-glucose 4,6-dehydratase
MKCLVTGGAGFIGQAVCRHLLDAGCAVVNLDKLTYAADLASLAELFGRPRYAFHQVDICDREDVAAIFAREQPDAVMHLAAESHVDRSIGEPSTFVITNVVGTYQLLEAARDYFDGLPGECAARFRFLHISTDEVYGSLGADGSFTETTAYDPNSPYSASKASADHFVAAWHRTYGLPILITNSCNNFGPHQFPEKLIPLIVTNAIMGLRLPVYGDGSNVRDWLYVEDHARALFAVLNRGRIGERYNVGARCERTNLELVNEICNCLDRRLPRGDGAPHSDAIRFVTDRPGHDFRYAIDPIRVENEVGWKPKLSFEAALERTVEWYIANQGWWREIRSKRYDGERLGLKPRRSNASLDLVAPAPGS